MNFKKKIVLSLLSVSLCGQMQNAFAQAPVLTNEADARAFLASHPSPVLQRTQNVLIKNEAGNAYDIALLWSNPLASEPAGLKAAVIDLLTADFQAVKNAVQCAVENRPALFGIAGWIPWRTSLNKFTDFTESGVQYTGFYEDALALVNAAEHVTSIFSADEDFSERPGNDLTLAKFLGVYVKAAQGMDVPHLLSSLKGFYPAGFEGNICHAALESTILAKGQPNIFSVPSRGFMYGGNLDTPDFNFADASGFVTHVTGADQSPYEGKRLYTALACEVLEPSKERSPAWQEDVVYFESIFQMQPLLEGAQVLDNAQPGDMLGWCSKPTHMSIFVGWADESHENAWIVDARRADTKAFEGTMLRTTPVNWNTKPYLARLQTLAIPDWAINKTDL